MWMSSTNRQTEGDGVRSNQRRSDIRLVGSGRIDGESRVLDGGRQSSGHPRGDVVVKEWSGGTRRSSASCHATVEPITRRPLYLQLHKYTDAIWRTAAKRHRHFHRPTASDV